MVIPAIVYKCIVMLSSQHNRKVMPSETSMLLNKATSIRHDLWKSKIKRTNIKILNPDLSIILSSSLTRYSVSSYRCSIFSGSSFCISSTIRFTLLAASILFTSSWAVMLSKITSWPLILCMFSSGCVFSFISAKSPNTK